MARRSSSFVCQNCGNVTNRWQGKCESCGEWNTIVEEAAATDRPQAIRSSRKGRLFALKSLAGDTNEAPRLASGMPELDRVTGGGFVRGSVLLVGGDPGIGKSTLLIQAAGSLARLGHRAVYISGEEAVAQVRLRADRLGLRDAVVELAAETTSPWPVTSVSESPPSWAAIAPSRRAGQGSLGDREHQSSLPSSPGMIQRDSSGSFSTERTRRRRGTPFAESRPPARPRSDPDRGRAGP